MALYLFEMPSSLMSFRYINIYRVSVLIDIGNGTARQVSIIDPRQQQQQQQQCIMEMMSQTKKGIEDVLIFLLSLIDDPLFSCLAIKNKGLLCSWLLLYYKRLL
jgi:hypothetical protein